MPRALADTCLCAKSLQSCLTDCDSRDGSPPVSSVHGILQARILEWVAISFSDRSSRPGIKPVSLMSSAMAGRLPGPKLVSHKHFVFVFVFLFI